MNTNIIKGRTINSSTLYDNFNQPLNVYDVVISCKRGRMTTHLITDIKDGIIKVFNETAKFHKYDVILADKILSAKAIEKIRNDYFESIKNSEEIKKNKIIRKCILGIWNNKISNKSGLCLIPIYSQPGKNILKSDIKTSISNTTPYINNSNYTFSFFTENNSKELSKDINNAYIFSEMACTNITGFYGGDSEASSFLMEDIETQQVELKPIINKNIYLIIMDSYINMKNNYKNIISNVSFINDNRHGCFLYSAMTYNFLNANSAVVCKSDIRSSIMNYIK